MALEASIFTHDPFNTCRNYVSSILQFGGGASNFLENQTESFNCELGNWNSSPSLPASNSISMMPCFSELNLRDSPSDATGAATNSGDQPPSEYAEMAVRQKRRRPRRKKDNEEIEKQRMTHIAVERNRRKQMNEYLSELRSLMPESYVQRGDQASIVGGAITYVKELEHRLHSLGAQTEIKEQSDGGAVAAPPFSEFFVFPQYRASLSHGGNSVTQSGVADIEVTMVDSHAILKIRSKRRSKQLLRVVSEMHSLRLTTLHLNVTTTRDQIVLYTLNLKVEDNCILNSADEIAIKVYEMFGTIQEEAMLS